MTRTRLARSSLALRPPPGARRRSPPSRRVVASCFCSSSEVVRIVRDLRNRSRLYGLEAVARAGILGRSAEEHSEMIDLTLSGDRENLEALVARHIGHVRNLWAGVADQPL
ncbi:FCD domain-containing protein [Streptomyces avermitilis]|uniref:FCD domain-containing protein n=1 Tax=Streptomyces avermitilis TaxID=33903 RepID=UPI003401642F